jgi:hypothetical protein
VGILLLQAFTADDAVSEEQSSHPEESSVTLVSKPATDLAQNPEVAHIKLPKTPSVISEITVSRQAKDLAQTTELAQGTGTNTPTDAEILDLQNQLNDLPNKRFPIPGGNRNTVAPALSFSNPVGFGADDNTVFAVASFQGRSRRGSKSDGEFGIGYAFGDAVKSVGAELSYTVDSLGTNTGFGSGGFNAKVHRRISNDSSVAVGWNHFAVINTGKGAVDYPKNSYYAAYTKIFRTQEFIEQPLSRVAVTVGVGSGQFLAEKEALKDNPSGINVFGSLGVRILKPVSAVVEWTGQDLAAGLSIVPFENFPLVITPGFRDITGAGDGARFVLGTGIAFKF